MFELALHYGEGPVPLHEVAKNEGLSEHYLEQLIAPLRRSGLVTSVRGAYGGYMLARDPSKITVGDVIRILEGPIAPVECVTEEIDYVCERSDKCVTHRIWKDVRDSITGVVDSISLQDLCQQERKIN